MSEQSTQLTLLQVEALKLFTREYDGSYWLHRVHDFAPIASTAVELKDLGLALRHDLGDGKHTTYHLTPAGIAELTKATRGRHVHSFSPVEQPNAYTEARARLHEIAYRDTAVAVTVRAEDLRTLLENTR